MNTNDIDNGLRDTLSRVPALTADVKLTKCDLAAACYLFLESIRPKAGFLGGIAIRAVNGKISDWRAANCSS